MTEKQKLIYEVIKSYISINRYGPTIRELCSLVGLNSSSTMHVHLHNLKEKGLIDFTPGKSRTIKLKEVKDE